MIDKRRRLRANQNVLAAPEDIIPCGFLDPHVYEYLVKNGGPQVVPD